MCIVIVKPKGAHVPKQKHLQNCIDANSSGAGFAYYRRGWDRVKIVKGFFTLEALTQAMKEHKVDESVHAVIHFRLATHGAVDAGNCHPFPIITDMEKMRETDFECTHAMAHNGVFSGLDHKKYSDTMLWTVSHLSDKAVLDGLKRPAIQHLIEDALGTSKLAIISPAVGETLMFGRWVHDKKSGCYYSNEGYKTKTYTFMSSGWSRDDWSSRWNDDWRKAYGYEDVRASTEKRTTTTPNVATVPDWDACEVCGSTYQLRTVEDMEVCATCAQQLTHG